MPWIDDSEIESMKKQRYCPTGETFVDAYNLGYKAAEEIAEAKIAKKESERSDEWSRRYKVEKERDELKEKYEVIVLENASLSKKLRKAKRHADKPQA